jgi:hypothetical protein
MDDSGKTIAFSASHITPTQKLLPPRRQLFYNCFIGQLVSWSVSKNGKLPMKKLRYKTYYIYIIYIIENSLHHQTIEK